MKYLIAQVAGVALAVLGGQGSIRLLSDPKDAGLLAQLPGDVSLKIGLYVIVTIAGGALASWAYGKTHPSSK